MGSVHDQAKALWESTAKALLSEDEVDEVYGRLETLQVELDPDPLIFGPKRLQEKIADSRRALGECERIYLDMSHRMHRLKRESRAKEAGLELATMKLFADDPEVRAPRNVKDREAHAAIKLKDEWLEVHQLNQAVMDHEALLVVIKAKRSDLRDTQARLRDQIRLCQTEVDLGGHWGTTDPRGGVPLVPGQGVAPSTDGLEEMMAEMDGEFHRGDLPEDEEEEDEGCPVCSGEGPCEHEIEFDLTGTWCADCGKPQFDTPSGICCPDGHGGADSLDNPPDQEPDPEPEVAPEPEPQPAPPDSDIGDALDALLESDLVPKAEGDVLPTTLPEGGEGVDSLIDAVEVPEEETEPPEPIGAVSDDNLDEIMEMFGEGV